MGIALSIGTQGLLMWMQYPVCFCSFLRKLKSLESVLMVYQTHSFFLPENDKHVCERFCRVNALDLLSVFILLLNKQKNCTRESCLYCKIPYYVQQTTSPILLSGMGTQSYRKVAYKHVTGQRTKLCSNQTKRTLNHFMTAVKLFYCLLSAVSNVSF